MAHLNGVGRVSGCGQDKGVADACGPSAAAIGAVLKNSASLQAAHGDGAVVGDAVGVAGAGIGQDQGGGGGRGQGIDGVVICYCICNHRL